jgi:quinol monooxygenase YgiN
LLAAAAGGGAGPSAAEVGPLGEEPSWRIITSSPGADAMLTRGLLAAGLVALGISIMTLTPVQSADPAAKVLRHVVLYRFKPELTAGQIQEVVDAFAALPAQIDAILRLEHGTNVSEEGKSDGLTHGFVVTFRDQQALQTYLQHPAHQAYVAVVRDRREKVVVFDYWTTD